MLLKHFQSLEKIGNGYIVHGDNADVMLVFMTDDIIRVRVSFDRQFKEESYTLVTTAWPDRMDEMLKNERTRITALDIPCEEDDKALTFRTKTLRLVMRKCPLSFLLYSADGQLIYADLRERAFEKDQLGRLSHYSRIDYAHDHFYGFGEKTGHLDKKGRPVVDETMATGVAGVYAVGDVNGRCMLAHAAIMQGIRCVNNILGRNDEIKLDIMPSAVFTNPEAAAVGLTEAQCKEAGLEYTVKKTPFRANGRAVADEADGGLIKLITKNDGTILGCHVCGAHAADIVQEAAALMSLGCTASKLHDITHIHPTIAELLRDSV